jgi:hypothetical protein
MATLAIARIKEDILTSPHWSAKRIATKGEHVFAVSADNLPEGSEIKWWIRPVAYTEWEGDAYGVGAYGVGAYDSDLEILTQVEIKK